MIFFFWRNKAQCDWGHLILTDNSHLTISSCARTSVCPSVSFSCPLHNSNTVHNIFMKLSTNINHHQRMRREQEIDTLPTFLRNYGPFKFFLRKWYLLYNFDTVKNVFMNLCARISHHKRMQQRIRTVTPPTSFYGIMPLWKCIWKSCPLCNFNNVDNIFMKVCTNIHLHQTGCR